MFKDRTDAGKKLSEKLSKFRNERNSLVLGITRGGVIIADEISKKLNIPLDVIVIKKLSAPGNQELAVGAIGPGRTVFWDKRLLKEVPITLDYKRHILKAKMAERKNLEKYLRDGKRGISVKEKLIILADDGIATGATVEAALLYLREKKAKKVVLATPVIAKDTYYRIADKFDSVVAIEISSKLNAVGQFYKKFDQVENEEVKDIIRKNNL